MEDIPLEHSHKYLNLVIDNLTSKAKVARTNIQRSSNILDQPEDYLLSIDRFFINYSTFPVWSPIIKDKNTELSFVFKVGSNGNEYSGTVQSTKKEYYSMKEVAKVLNGCLEDMIEELNTAEDTSYNNPEFSFSNNLFSISSDADFRNDIQFYFNEKAFSYLNTFEFDEINPVDLTKYAIISLSSDTETQSSHTCEMWSPLQKIVVKCTLPIAAEFTPDRDSNLSYSSSTEAILTDFVIFTTNSSPVEIINYVASGNHRWISMSQQSEFTNFEISFFWVDKQGNEFNLMVPPLANIEMKLLFKKIGAL